MNKMEKKPNEQYLRGFVELAKSFLSVEHYYELKNFQKTLFKKEIRKSGSFSDPVII